MPQIHQSALVPYSAEQMYRLVNDYERYPDFVPGCVASRTLAKTEDSLIGELTVSKAGIRQTFATRNRLLPYREIGIQLESGPFQFLNGKWLFDPLDQHSCKISLQLSFDFSNPLVRFAFGSIFNELTARLIDAFKKRAKEVYDGKN